MVLPNPMLARYKQYQTFILTGLPQRFSEIANLKNYAQHPLPLYTNQFQSYCYEVEDSRIQQVSAFLAAKDDMLFQELQPYGHRQLVAQVRSNLHHSREEHSTER